MGTTPRLNRLLDGNSEAGMLPIDRYSAVIAFAAGIERELTAEQKRYDELRATLARETARGDRLEKALREAIIALDEVGVIDPNFDRVENAIVFARAALETAMAKKREWKAWMVVDKNSNPSMDLFGRVASVYRAKRNAKLGCDRGCEIIRVRIVEDGK